MTLLGFQVEYRCVTSHLSMFSVLDILLDCTNLNVLSEDGLLQIILRPNWWSRWPGLFLWLLLSALVLLVLFGANRDAKTHKSGIWRDEYFLTELPPVSDPSRLSRLCRFLRHPYQSSATARAPKSQPRATRTMTPTPTHIAAAKMRALNDRVRKLKPASSQKLKEKVMCQNTLAEAALHNRLHRASIQAHIWGQQGWIQGSLAVQQSPKLKELVRDMEESLPKDFVAVHTSKVHRLWSIFLAVHPVYELLHVDLHVTAAKRAKINMDCILGSLTFLAIFFSADGSAVSARNPADCPVQQNSVLWIVLISLVSVFLNFVPRHLASWRYK